MANELMVLEDLRVRVDVKTIRESGNSISSASGGTTITFAKTFAEIRSVQVTANGDGTEDLVCIYDLDQGAANPTTMDVYIFLSGVKVERNFSWFVEGIQGV